VSELQIRETGNIIQASTGMADYNTQCIAGRSVSAAPRHPLVLGDNRTVFCEKLENCREINLMASGQPGEFDMTGVLVVVIRHTDLLYSNSRTGRDQPAPSTSTMS
jgi:hypothetical protein